MPQTAADFTFSPLRHKFKNNSKQWPFGAGYCPKFSKLILGSLVRPREEGMAPSWLASRNNAGLAVSWQDRSLPWQASTEKTRALRWVNVHAAQAR